MKQKLLNLWLLAVMMIVGSSGAWALEQLTAPVKMTYVSGTDADAGTSYGEVTTAYCGYNKISGGQVALGNKGWGVNNIAYLQVDASAIPAGATIITASLQVDCQQITNRGLNYGVGYNTTAWSSTMTWNTADRSITTIGSVINGSKTATDKQNTFDIKAAFNGDADNIVTILVYQTAAGGGYVKNPVATITYTTDPVFTATFTETNGLAPTVTIYSDAAMTTEMINGALLNGETYYYKAVLAGYKDYTGSFTVSGAAPSVSLTMTAKAVYSYTVKALDGTKELGTVASGSDYEDETVSYYYPAFVLSGTTLYSKAANNSYPSWGASVKLDTDNKIVNIAYTALDGECVYYSEGENVTGAKAYTTTTFAPRSSAGSTGVLSGVTLIDLAPGKYKVTTRGIGKANNKLNIYTGSVEGTQVLSVTTATSGTVGTSDEFTLLETTAIVANGGYYTTSDNGYGFDYIYIMRNGEAPLPAVYKTKAELSGELEGFTATINGNVLTLTSTTEGMGFTNVKLNMTKGTPSANTGSIASATNIWTGNTRTLVLTFDDINDLNSIAISNAVVPELPTAATIADFKATTAETLLTLTNAEVLEVNAEEGYTIVQDATAGLKLKGIVLNATAGNRLVGTLAGIYADNAELVNGTQTDYTAPKASGNAATAMDMTATEAQTAANVYRLVSLKGVSITNDGTKVTATDKSGTITVDPGTLTLTNGDVLASLTGFFYPDGTMKATAAQSGLIWKANDMTAGQALPIDLTAANYVNKLADVAMGDVIVIETLGAGTIDILDAAGASVVKYELTQDENTLHFPVTADVVNNIAKHGLQLVGTGVKAVMAYNIPSLYSANMTDNTIWYSDEDLAANYTTTLGAIHFTDVREGDELGGTVLTADAAAAQQDNTYDATGKAQVDLVKNAVRDDKAEAEEGEEYGEDGYQQTNGMVMTFGGASKGQTYTFAEAYPAVNKFDAVTEGINQFPVDDNDNAYDPAQKNVPTKGTFYVFNPTKDGALDVTVALEEGKKLYVTEEGEALDDFNGITKVTDNMISFPVEAGKTYYVFANESNLQYYGFTFKPTDAAAQDLAKNIDIFKKLTAGTEAKLMLNDAVVTYINGDDVFVEDESGAIDFFETRIQYYDGQKLNGYIIGENNSLNNLPVLRWTAATPTSKFTAEKGKAQSKKATVAEALKDNGLARFVKLYSLAQARDERGLRILLDEAGDTIYIEDHFNVFYELPDTVKHVEGIVGINAEENRYIWPTSQDAVVANLPMEQIADGKYLLRNVASGLYLGAANNWGTRATLMNYSEYVTLKAIDAETYTIESQVSNGGTSYYFNGSYMDGAATNVTLAKDGKYYTIKSADKFIGFSDAEPAYVTGMYALGLDVDGDSPEALWEIIPATADALKGASQANPVDATFMVLNPNFGRNNRNTSAWTISASNQNLSGGTNENKCAESYHSAFTLNQTITGLPIGTYKLTAQGFYRQDGSDTENLPYFYVNDQKRTFPVKTGAENSMDDASASFAKGLYTIEPITVTIVDGILNIGAKNDNTALWCIWDNFQLKYCGTANVTIDMFVEAYETALDAANQLVGEKMSKNALNQLNDAIGAEVDKTSQESLTAATNALNEAIDAAKGSIESYKILAVGTLADNNLTGWTCTNANTFHINTWSVEGNEGNDPSGMVTPFIENWVGKPGPLGEGKIFYTLKNINPSEVKVTALVRIYSESGEEPQGASFFVGKQKVDIATVGTSFEYNGMKGIYGTIEATGTTINGSIVFGVEMASPTFNWVAIKNVTIEATEKDDIPAKTLNFTPDYWNNTNVQMELGTTEVAKAWDTANKVDQPLYNVTMPEEFSGSLALQTVKDWDGETKGWWLRSAVGGLYAYGARRPAAITNLKAGNYVVFTCTRDASGVITLLNGEGQPDGPYTFEKDADGRYCCTMTANGNLGFCGVMNVGYLKTIDIYDSKPVVTGIENVQSRLSDTEAVYNLRGQKVTGTLKPGLYIKNGKKVVIK